jgi:hypothetical protein
MHKLASQGASMNSRSKIRIEQFFGAGGKYGWRYRVQFKQKGLSPQLLACVLLSTRVKEECNKGASSSLGTAFIIPVEAAARLRK